MTSGENSTFGAAPLDRRRGALRPVARRGRWIAGGLAVQLVGVGGPIGYVYGRAKHLGVGDALTLATVKLAWHNSLHTKAGAAVLIVGVVLFAIGSVLLARPFTKNVVTLVLAVPLAAALGALVLGVVALIVALLIALADAGFDGGGSGGGGRPTRRGDEKSPDEEERPRVYGLEAIESAQRDRPPGAVDPDA